MKMDATRGICRIADMKIPALRKIVLCFFLMVLAACFLRAAD